MDTEQIIEALEAERNRLDAAIAALQGRRTTSGRGKGRPKRKPMSAGARKKISMAQKARWKKQKAT